MKDIGADGLPDDRVTCSLCRHYRNHKCEALRVSAFPDLPLRCVTFVPLVGAQDKRTGEKRWPWLPAYLEEIRKLDRSAT